jgi:hypothetical protein
MVPRDGAAAASTGDADGLGADVTVSVLTLLASLPALVGS